MKKMGRDYCTGNPYEYDDGQPEPVPAPAEPAQEVCGKVAHNRFGIIHCDLPPNHEGDCDFGKVPTEPPHVACSCPMCCPVKYEINAALANAAEYTCPRCDSKISTHICMKAEPVAGETPAGKICPGCSREIAFGAKVVEGPFKTWYHKGCISEPPAPAVAARCPECGSNWKNQHFRVSDEPGKEFCKHTWHKLEDAADPVSGDLEGKLRELRDTMVNWTHCTPSFATNVVTEAAALGPKKCGSL